jgi:hypothetical protein
VTETNFIGEGFSPQELTLVLYKSSIRWMKSKKLELKENLYTKYITSKGCIHIIVLSNCYSAMSYMM